MMESDSFDENFYWEEILKQERIDVDWLDYNPHAFLPLDFESFLWTGHIGRINVELQTPPEDWKPIFIVGCGRSGMTVLCKLLSAHPDVCFLNEPRQLWMQVCKSFDVLSAKCKKRGGKLRMNRADASPEKAEALRQLFYSFTKMLNRNYLVEKSPENIFRLKWLSTLFPNCKFIIMHRNPISTARSISRFQPHSWYGHENYKWNCLKLLAKKFDVRFT